MFNTFNTSGVIWAPKHLATKIAIMDPGTGKPLQDLRCDPAGTEKINALNKTMTAYKYACTAKDRNQTATITLWLTSDGTMLKAQITTRKSSYQITLTEIKKG